MEKEYVVLVDEKDNELGAMEKMEAHKKAVLHRAFSIFVFNPENKLMLQQRALHKYHSPGLWTNTCCSHPRLNESLKDATQRRLMEEMGFNCTLKKAFDFTYKAVVGQGLTEHEFDHVFIGYNDQKPQINPDEVAGWKYMSLDEVQEDMKKRPEMYTVWFRIAFDELTKHVKF